MPLRDSDFGGSEIPYPLQPAELPWDTNSLISLNYKNELHKGQTKEKRTSADPEFREQNKTSCDFETAILETGYGKYNVFLLLASIPGFFGCSITTSSVSLILPSAECDLQLDSFDMGLMNSISYIGMITGAFVWGFFSDIYGRKRILVIAFVMDTILTVTFALAQSFLIFLAVKLLSGFMNAAPYAILMAFIAECHASKYRARNLLWTGIFSSLSGTFLSGAAWVIIPLPIHVYLFDGLLSIPSWRVFLLVSATPSLIASILLSFFGESPKFLMSRGRNKDAMEVFKTMYALNTGKPRDTYPVKSLAVEGNDSREDSGRFSSLRQGLSQIKPLFHKPYVRNMILACALQFLSLCGLNSIRLWLPALLSKILDKEKTYNDGYMPSTICELLTPEEDNTTEILEYVQCTPHTVQSGVYTNTMIISGIGGVGYLLSGYLVAKLGKRVLLFILYGIAGACSIGMYWSGNSNLMVGITSVFVTLLSIASTAIISVVVDVMQTDQRSMSVCLTMMFGRMGAMVGNLTFAVLLEWNCTILFFMIAGTTMVSAGLSFLLPVTKGAALK